MNRKVECGLNIVPTVGTMVLGGLGEWEETTKLNNNGQSNRGAWLLKQTFWMT